MRKINFNINRLFEEIMLYSGQFGLFYILMQFIIQRNEFWGNLGHVVLLVAIVVQAIVLSVVEDNLIYRILFSFIVPIAYSSIELSEGIEKLANAAHMGFWIYAIVSVSLMILKKRKNEITQYIVEYLFVILNIFIYVFLYFYFDTLKEVVDLNNLTIFKIFNYWDHFLQNPTHWYVMFGGIILAVTIAFGRHQLHKLKNRIALLFGQYVDVGLRDTIIEKGEFTSTRRELCILFSDIINFTKLCESNEASKVSEMLNTYFEYWNSIIKKHCGTIDKYIGDAIMVIFGLEDEQHSSENTINCALEAINNWNNLIESLISKNLPIPDGFGIGCHFGELIIGDIGSKDRKNITVVGDTVNIASRLEAMTRNTNNELLISESIFEKINIGLQSKFEKIGMVKVKGKTNSIMIWGNKK